MQHYCLWEEAAGALQTVGVSHEMQLPAPADGQRWIAMTNDSGTHTLVRCGDAIVEEPHPVAAPIALMTAKLDARTAAAAANERRRFGGCNTPKGRADTDEKSQLAIYGAVVGGGSREWKMADNQIVDHTAAEMQDLAAAVSQFLTDCHLAWQAIKAAIEAADTPAAAAAVDVTAGYPA